MTTPFTSLPCVSAEEAREIVTVVDRLSPYYTSRFMESGLEFWTLGTSVYIDLDKAHGEGSRYTKSIMSGELHSFYEKVFSTLSAHFGVPVSSPRFVNQPGFHIFKNLSGLPRGVAYGGAIHKDRQFESSLFTFPYTDVLSFTMILEEPSLGSSVNYWDDDSLSDRMETKYFCGESDDLKRDLLAGVKSYDYKVGEICVHDGQTLHQIANMVDVLEGERRISLQGHGVLTDTGYIVYF